MESVTTAPGRRPFNRRTLAKGAVWSVPAAAVVTAAPAFASSCAAQPFALSYTPGNYTRGGTASASGTVQTRTVPTAGTTTFGFTVASGNLGAVTRVAANLTATSTAIFGGITTALILQHSAQGTTTGDNGQAVTFTFDRAVSNLRLVIGDLDRTGANSSNFRDAVYFTTAPATAAAPTVTPLNATYVTGAGTQANKLRGTSTAPTTVGGVDGVSDSSGNATVQFDATPLTSLTINYVNVGTADVAQDVLISSMTFDAFGSGTGCAG